MVSAGDNDANDFVDRFLADEDQIDPDAVNDLYVLVNFRPGSRTGTGGWIAAGGSWSCSSNAGITES